MYARWPSVLFAVALAAVGTGVALLVVSSGDEGGRVTGVNVPVNAGATNPRDITANNSPTLVGNPRRAANLVVVNRIDTPRFACAVHLSFDGGAQWAPGALPFPAGEEDPPRCFAPDAAFGPDGTLYVSFVTLKGVGNTPNAAWVVSSADGGRTFSAPVRAAGPLTFHLRLTADPTRTGRIYLSWLHATETGAFAFPTPGHPIVVARSDDGGRTFAAPIRVSHPRRQRVVAPSPAPGPRGELHISYLDVGEDSLDYHGAHQGRGGDPYPGTWSLILARSADGGSTWQETVVERRLVPTERFIVFFSPAPTVAVDRSGRRVHVAFHDGRLGEPDVWVWTSDDGGASFSAPVRVNDTRGRDGRAQYLPKVSVAPGGRVDVVYYDRRADPRNVLNEVSLQSSWDRGRTFSGRLRLSDTAFDSRIGFGSERGMPDLGSRLALLSTDRRAVAVWTDTRSGTQASNKQDLAQATVEFG